MLFRTLSKFKPQLISDSMDIIVKQTLEALLLEWWSQTGFNNNSFSLEKLLSPDATVTGIDNCKSSVQYKIRERGCLIRSLWGKMHNAITIPIEQYIRNYELNLIFRRQVVVTVETAMSFYCKSTKRLQLKQKRASKLKTLCLNYSCYWKD